MPHGEGQAVDIRRVGRRSDESSAAANSSCVGSRPHLLAMVGCGRGTAVRGDRAQISWLWSGADGVLQLAGRRADVSLEAAVSSWLRPLAGARSCRRKGSGTRFAQQRR